MRAHPIIERLSHLWQKEIWRQEHLKDRSLRGRGYALLRILSITVTGVNETRAPSRAAALSFSTLLGLGPLIAMAVLVAGFVFDRDDPDLAVNTLNRLIRFIAPQIVQYESLDPRASPAEDAGPAAAENPADDAPVAVNPELVSLIDGFIEGSRSSTAGIVGLITLIVIVLQLFTSVENTFNDIWGVRRGRSWVMRVGFYWTVLTLGAVLFFAAVTTLSAGAFMNFFAENVPFGSTLVALLRWALPSLSIVLLVLVLTLFYRCIPNTHVWWRAALGGAVVVAALVVANNFLAFLYVSRVVQQKSLFGSLGILPILMFGLYVFWFFVLLGGHVSYAIQNVHFRNSQAVWNNLAETMRERLSLVVLLTISRRFHECLPPCTATQLSDMLKVPTNILNEALNRLGRMGLVTPIPPAPAEATTDFRYQPARPLGRMSLAEFKRLDDELGDDPAGPLLAEVDPLVRRYDEARLVLVSDEFFQRSLEDHFRDHPVAESHPPFAFGERVKRVPEPE